MFVCKDEKRKLAPKRKRKRKSEEEQQRKITDKKRAKEIRRKETEHKIIYFSFLFFPGIKLRFWCLSNLIIYNYVE
jgi:hypothetical protein